MTKLQEWLTRACTELGLRIDLDFKPALPSGRVLVALARIPDLGAANGMIIAVSFDALRDSTDELVSNDYGYSVLSEPDPHEEFDLASYVEVFSDWGWARKAEQKPPWML